MLVTRKSEEVAPVLIYVTERPWALPAALAPVSDVRCILAADTPQRSQVHQVLTQAELVQAHASAERQGTNGFTGNGFTGNGVRLAAKRMDVSGVPPRGRPV
jgi:hypothetical protein